MNAEISESVGKQILGPIRAKELRFLLRSRKLTKANKLGLCKQILEIRLRFWKLCRNYNTGRARQLGLGVQSYRLVEIVELDSQASPLVQVYFVAHNR